MAQDRGNWRVVNTVMHLWVPSYVVSFLTELLPFHEGQHFVKFIYLFIYLFIHSFILSLHSVNCSVLHLINSGSVTTYQGAHDDAFG